MRHPKSSVVAQLASRILRRSPEEIPSGDHLPSHRRRCDRGGFDGDRPLGRLARESVRAFLRLLPGLTVRIGRSSRISETWIPLSAIAAFLKSVHIRPHRDVLLCFGAGCREVVTLAAAFPFRRIIGLIHDTDTRESALPRINAAAPEYERPQLIHCREHEVPESLLGEATFVLLIDDSTDFDSGPIVAGLQRTLVNRPRKVMVLDSRPADQPSPFEGQPTLRFVRHLPTGETHQLRLSVYRSVLPIYPEHMPGMTVGGHHSLSVPFSEGASTAEGTTGRTRPHPLCFEGDFQIEP